jgi:DNA processing protein
VGDLIPLRPGIRVIGRRSGEYPALLREVDPPPAELFALGRPLEPAPMVSIVGSRRASRYGLEVAAWLAGGLARAGFVVVSGMALGIDAAAHRGALDAGGTTLAVLGCGLDVAYPHGNAGLRAAIRDRGTLLSEYPAGTRPAPWHFPVRNRIIAGLSLGTVIVEARDTGGAMITARLAADLGREVFAVPGPVNSPGSRGAHLLVREGARLVTSAAEVLEDLGFAPVPEPCAAEGRTGGIGPDELRLLAVLEGDPQVLDIVARGAGLPVPATAAVLARLELRGLVTRHAGGRFARAVGAAGA